MKKKLSKIILVTLCITFLFSGCSLEKLAEAKIKYDVNDTQAIVKQVPNKSTITEINIPDEYEGLPVTIVKDFSATNLENVEKITIGKNVKEIGTWAFENNQKLKEFDVDEENEYFCDVDGVLFTKDMKTLLFYPANKDLQKQTKTNDNGESEEIEFSTYIIPEGVETICTKAFYKCQKLKSITLPSTVKTIEEKAFFRCSMAENIILPEGLTFIGKDAFSYCTTFNQITIPSTVTKIDTYAFYNCKSLLEIDILAKENEIELADKWYPTDNGKKIVDLKIEYK